MREVDPKLCVSFTIQLCFAVICYILTHCKKSELLSFVENQILELFPILILYPGMRMQLTQHGKIG